MAKTNFLDADDTILEKNLKFVKNNVEEELNQIFGGDQVPQTSVPPRDYKVVTPKPGDYESNWKRFREAISVHNLAVKVK